MNAKPDYLRKSESLRVNVTEAERVWLEARAKALGGVSVAHVIRQAISLYQKESNRV